MAAKLRLQAASSVWQKRGISVDIWRRQKNNSNAARISRSPLRTMA